MTSEYMDILRVPCCRMTEYGIAREALPEEVTFGLVLKIMGKVWMGQLTEIS